jgi:hypothetical protein
MPRFADYHRTVVGYHGTRRSTALRVVQGLEGYKRSENSDDWLGHGIYFWDDPVDTCRAVFVPSSERLWARSGLYKNAHIQLCVRNPDCMLGTWLVKPLKD